MNTVMQKIKIAIAEDHPLFRKGIIKLLDPDRYEFLFDVDNGEKLIEVVQSHADNLPDIIIMDINMPHLNGYDAVEWLKKYYPGIKILIVSELDREESIVRMLKLGVRGYLSKQMEPEDLFAALQSIARNGYYYTDFITNKLVHSLQNEDNNKIGGQLSQLHSESWNQLNHKQKEYVRYACTEMTYEQIAEKMCVSPKTIDGYRDVVFQKFNVKNRVGLVLFALRNGLVSL